MKKIAVVLFCLLSITSFAFADDDVQVTWTLTGDDAPSKLNIGFYDEAASESPSNGVVLANDTTSGLVGKKDVFIKWDILTSTSVTVSIYSAALSGGESNSINWEGTISEDTSNSSKVEEFLPSLGSKTSNDGTEYGSSDSPKTLFTYDSADGLGMGDVGCLKMSIETEDATSKNPAAYSTTLYVAITEGTGVNG